VNPFLSIGYAAELFGVPRREAYLNPRLAVRLRLAASELLRIQPKYSYNCGLVFWVEDYGGKIAMRSDSDAPFVEKRPLKTAEDIERLEILDVDEICKGPTMAKQWEALETAEKLMGSMFEPWSYSWEPFGIACNWLGYQKLLFWIKKDPLLIHKLMRKVVEHCVNANIAVARKYGKCFIHTGSIFANSETLSPSQIKEFHIDYLSEMVKRSFKAGAGPGILYHLCGDHSRDWSLHKDVPITAETQMHVTQFGRETADLTEVISLFGKQCIILGNLSSTLLRFGSPKQVYDEVKRQIIKYKHSPKGFVVSTACDIPLGTPPGNVYSITKAANDYGRIP
jgi:uroporphyrinogen decarboxylase